ncbi:hypothetical protein BO94DRAFT_585641 [Aspergillus sclerotioniger CBS 115572]|uniref:Uncharacterized protein n=1 Tax=Aspergillus sclerotioniger CBS 115572 TaxID=1450535 RepID=A0A317WQ76_9EURO|nr:hypothetical protein BO94DRAFT_585641 [Aspergillus sclerotioniger CBS 115572]PWY87068.1 hypothetical protein BO94DRAFT_585641 [Aspergillus sclerotioniger CBS 115572]
MFLPVLSPREQPNNNGNGSVRVAVPRPERFPGVDYDDVPFLGPRPSDAMLEYYEQPVLRKLEWRVDENGVKMRRPLKDTVSLTAAFAQTRGSEVQMPCHHCNVNRSVWTRCVVGSDTKEGSNMHGACASCRFSRRYCSLISRNEDERAMTRSGDASESQSHWDPVRGIKTEPGARLSSPGSCRLDGDVIPFPLGPETIDNLPLLKQADKEMEMHLDTLKRRIRQLEERENDGDETTNPWDLV